MAIFEFFQVGSQVNDVSEWFAVLRKPAIVWFRNFHFRLTRNKILFEDVLMCVVLQDGNLAQNHVSNVVLELLGRN